MKKLKELVKGNLQLIISVGGLLLIVLAIVGVTKLASGTSEVDSKAYKDIKAGLEKLKDYEDAYIIANTIEAPDGNVNYLEVVTKGGDSYTEYPVDAEGNVGVVSEDSATENYIMSDWRSSDGDMYLLNESEDDEGNYELSSQKLPKDYADKIESRNYMFLDTMLDKFISIKRLETVSADLGNGEESYDLYECKLPAECVKYILGIGSQGLYDSIEKECADDENVVDYCRHFSDEYDMDLTFSDAIVTVGLVDGLVKYISIEVGGLGTRMYVTKVMVTENVEVRSTPDLSGAVDYVETNIKEMADYIASFDSWEEAMEALNAESDTSTEGLESITEEVVTDESISVE